MRILWLMTRYWPAVGGAETHARQIIRQLAERGHTITVVTHWDSNRTDWLRGTTVLAPSETRRYADGEAAQVVRLGFDTPRRARTALAGATFYLRQTGATHTLASLLEADILRECGDQWDLVHGVRIGREPLYTAGYSIARRLGIPFVFTPLHHPRWVGPRYRTYLQLYAQADALTALTEHERALYGTLGASLDRVVVTGHGPTLPSSAEGARFRSQYGVSGPLVVFLGQKYAYKGYEDLLAAATRVWRARPDTTFAFLGPRTPASRRAFAAVRDSRILELDAVDLQTKGDALAGCDIFCLPSTQESFGGVYTEAWSYGKPVIGCDIPAVREVIEDGVTGLMARPHDPDSLATQIERLLADATLRERLGAQGQALATQRYTWEHITDRVEAAYAIAHVRQPEQALARR